MDWQAFFAELKGELLVLGNPPWVTNAGMGAIGGRNLPIKNNFQNHRGFAAKTGKANFDISEWMLIRLLEALNRRRACLAMLCKMATARKVLKHAWLHDFAVRRASVHLIDAGKHFGVAVEACLLIVHTGEAGAAKKASTYGGLSFESLLSTFGLFGKELVADFDEFHQLSDLDGVCYYTWRSGVKHDAAKVMEFTQSGQRFHNGLDAEIAIESTYLYPLLKSSDLANGAIHPSRFVLLTQRHPSDGTAEISEKAPATWQYLQQHAKQLDARQSIIYQKRPRFSVFGVGAYTFSPWKVAISGLYKTLKFRVIGRFHQKPIVVDDTCYFIACRSQQEAEFVCCLLNSDLCQRFMRSLIFFDAKRPVTMDVLNRIDLKRLADQLGLSALANRYLADARSLENEQPQLVFEKNRQSRRRTPRKRYGSD